MGRKSRHNVCPQGIIRTNPGFLVVQGLGGLPLFFFRGTANEAQSERRGDLQPEVVSRQDGHSGYRSLPAGKMTAFQHDRQGDRDRKISTTPITGRVLILL